MCLAAVAAAASVSSVPTTMLDVKTKTWRIDSVICVLLRLSLVRMMFDVDVADNRRMLAVDDLVVVAP